MYYFIFKVAFFICFSAWIFGDDGLTKISPPKSIEIAIEYARTLDEQALGLMQRPSLPTDSGMLFTYPDEKPRTFWMLNTWIDLSLALLDRNQVIREIHEMKAYPHLKTHPIKNIKDLDHLAPNDPAVAFFGKHLTSSRYPARYALEMNKQWFAKQKVKVGDVLIWNPSTSKAHILQTVDIGPFIYSKSQPTTLELPEKTPIAVWLPDEEQEYHIVFLDSKGVPVQTSFLKGGKRFSSAYKPVVHTSHFVKYLMITPVKITLD